MTEGGQCDQPASRGLAAWPLSTRTPKPPARHFPAFSHPGSSFSEGLVWAQQQYVSLQSRTSLARVKRPGSEVCVYAELAVTAATSQETPRPGFQTPLLDWTPQTGENFASPDCFLIIDTEQKRSRGQQSFIAVLFCVHPPHWGPQLVPLLP